MGEWIPTEPIEEEFDLLQKGKKEKFTGAPGKLSLSYCYAGQSKPRASPPALRPAPERRLCQLQLTRWWLALQRQATSAPRTH